MAHTYPYTHIETHTHRHTHRYSHACGELILNKYYAYNTWDQLKTIKRAFIVRKVRECVRQCLCVWASVWLCLMACIRFIIYAVHAAPCAKPKNSRFRSANFRIHIWFQSFHLCLLPSTFKLPSCPCSSTSCSLSNSCSATLTPQHTGSNSLHTALNSY